MSCTHCGTDYQLAEAMLGKKARCKSCTKVFTIIPSTATKPMDSDEFEPPRTNGSTARLRPVSRQEEQAPDPMDALADAALQSGSHHRPTHRPIAAYTQPSAEEFDRRPKRMARGAGASMVLGIISLTLAVAGGVLCIFMVVNGKDDGLVARLGGISVGLTVIAAVLCMIAVANATSATKHIRHARHPLNGRTQAKTGSITGLIALVLVLTTLIGGGVWMWKRGGIVFEQTVGPDGKPLAPATTPRPPQ